jgi:SAM-dependent methyltransferase
VCCTWALIEECAMDRRSFIGGSVTGLAAAVAGARHARAENGVEIVAAMASRGTEPRISGSFFDLIHVNWFDAAYWTDRCIHWGEDRWRALIRDMHGIGIDTAICGATAFWGRPLFPGYEKTVGIPVKFGCEDPLGACVDEAERLGMKMFLGVGVRGRVSQVRDYTRMEPPWPDVWFKWNTALAEALVERFGARKCFAGLYVSYEIDFRDHQIDLYEKLIKQHLRPAVGNVKLLASPGNLGHHRKLDQLPRQLERMGIDILAPQDYGGRRWDVKAALGLVRQNARALEKVGRALRDAGVVLWSNCEVFNLRGNPSGRGACVPGPIGRIAQQIEMQAPLVQKLICYQYQGIMNRHTKLVDIGHPDTDKLYRAYVDYLAKRFPARFKLWVPGWRSEPSQMGAP